MKTPREWIIEYPAPVNISDLTVPISPWKLEEWIVISEQRWRKRTKRLDKQMAALTGKKTDVAMLPLTLTQCVKTLKIGRTRGARADYRFRNINTGETIPATTIGL